MQVVFLGTGTSSGVPMAACRCKICQSKNSKDKRLRSSILIRAGEKTFVVDCGPDFRQQMLRENVTQVDAILFTHAHRDHTGGIDDIRGFNFATKKEMPLYLHQETLATLKMHYEYIFNGNDYPGIPKVDIHVIENKPFKAEGIDVIPIEVLHYQMRVFGFRIQDFTYITDANFISPQEKEKIKGSKVLVLNALRRESHLSHYNLKQALEIIEELKPEKTYLTHLSHQMGLHDEVNKELPDGVELAYDGLKIQL